MFASALRGGPVEIAADAISARHWSIDALEHAATPPAQAITVRTGALAAPEAAARVLREVAWHEAGTAGLDIARFLARWPDPGRMQGLLAACEAFRVRTTIARRYPGTQASLARLDALERRTLAGATAASGEAAARTRHGTPMERALHRVRLGMPPAPDDPRLPPWLLAALQALQQPQAGVLDSARCAIACWRLAQGDEIRPDDIEVAGPPAPPGPAPAQRPSAGTDRVDPDATEVDEAPGDEGSETLDGSPEAGAGEAAAGRARPLAARGATTDENGIRVDEWNEFERRLLRRWCRIVVGRPTPGSADYRTDLLQRERAQARRLRRLFARLRDASTRRQRVAGDGEEIDADELVRAIVERRAGPGADEPRMIRRVHARRDVAVAVLLDVSASTDFVLRDPAAPAVPARIADEDDEDDPFFWSLVTSEPDSPEAAGEPPRRVIDVARDAVGLLAHAFEALGDHHALYAFSGSGREQVDFLVVKDFDEPMDSPRWQALAGLEPMRSTRMGAAIRHATDRLARRPERMRILLVISDGYPDDIDYGPDRRSVEYGLRDTARAIEQARVRGIAPLLVTVDRAGHDYLRRICPPGRYRVIDEIESLADEIGRAYRAVAG